MVNCSFLLPRAHVEWHSHLKRIETIVLGLLCMCEPQKFYEHSRQLACGRGDPICYDACPHLPKLSKALRCDACGIIVRFVVNLMENLLIVRQYQRRFFENHFNEFIHFNSRSPVHAKRLNVDLLNFSRIFRFFPCQS